MLFENAVLDYINNCQAYKAYRENQNRVFDCDELPVF